MSRNTHTHTQPEAMQLLVMLPSAVSEVLRALGLQHTTPVGPAVHTRHRHHHHLDHHKPQPAPGHPPAHAAPHSRWHTAIGRWPRSSRVLLCRSWLAQGAATGCVGFVGAVGAEVLTHAGTVRSGCQCVGNAAAYRHGPAMLPSSTRATANASRSGRRVTCLPTQHASQP